MSPRPAVARRRRRKAQWKRRVLKVRGSGLPGCSKDAPRGAMETFTDNVSFDVSHMGELHVDGPTAPAFLQGMLSNDVERIGDGEAQYTLLTNEQGGIVDDLIVYRFAPGQYLLVVNASNRAAVYDWLKEREPRGCEVRDTSDDYGLVAVQGPRSLERLELPDQ